MNFPEILTPMFTTTTVHTVKRDTYFGVVVVLRSPIHANEPSEYNGMLYRTSNRVLNNGIKVIILICMDGTSQYHHHLFRAYFACSRMGPMTGVPVDPS